MTTEKKKIGNIASNVTLSHSFTLVSVALMAGVPLAGVPHGTWLVVLFNLWSSLLPSNRFSLDLVVSFWPLLCLGVIVLDSLEGMDDSSQNSPAYHVGVTAGIRKSSRERVPPWVSWPAILYRDASGDEREGKVARRNGVRENDFQNRVCYELPKVRRSR